MSLASRTPISTRNLFLAPVPARSYISTGRMTTGAGTTKALDSTWIEFAPINGLRSNRSVVVRASASAPPSSVAGIHPKDLLIVGPGVLGSVAGSMWLKRNADATVMGQTNSTSNHALLKSMGLTTRTKSEADATRYPFVLFAAPPSGSDDYIAEIKAALARWDGRGNFVFTSSAGVYAQEDLSLVNEDSPTVPLGANDRTDRLQNAENAVLEAGGTVVRLVGLYHATRGAHTFFLRQGKVARPGSYTVNLIHYEDAAALCVAALAGGASGEAFRGRVFLGADGHPVTFAAMMEATLASGKFQGTVEFTGAEGPVKGKRVENAATRAALGWQPVYTSYEGFMRAGAEDVYTRTEAGKLGARHQG